MDGTVIDYQTGEVLTTEDISRADPGDQMALTLIHGARVSIEQARDIVEVMDVMSVAKAAVAFYAAQGMEENAQIAREASIRAQRKAGEFVKVMPKATGGQPYQNNPTGSIVEPVETVPTLADLDIDKHESYRWQLMADVPEETFEKYIDEKLAKGHELTAGGLVKIGKQVRAKDKAEAAPIPTGKYRVFYADPPWKYNDKLVEGYGPAEYHYPTMTIEELCALPVEDMADDNAVLFLWVTSPFLEDSFKIIRAWGFEYKASFVWDKIGHNYGHYNSVRHEFLLVCTRGRCTPDNQTLFDSVQSIQKSDKHSQKPDEFRKIIETLYTEGERLELFARGRFDGWSVWGNEAK